MTESLVVSIFHIDNIAEINSLSLNDYGISINNYFNDRNTSNFYEQYFKWFNSSKFEKSNTSFLKEFNKSLRDFFF